MKFIRLCSVETNRDVLIRASLVATVEDEGDCRALFDEDETHLGDFKESMDFIREALEKTDAR